jgi:hypothetical protein
VGDADANGRGWLEKEGGSVSEQTRDRAIVAMQAGDPAEIVDALTAHITFTHGVAERAREACGGRSWPKADVFAAAVKGITSLKREDGIDVVRSIATFFGVKTC